MGINRREFLTGSIGLAAATSLANVPLISWMASAKESTGKLSHLIWATGISPQENVRQAVAALGGIEKFVKPGSKVFLKPNCITRLSPEYAVNTNPEVVREVARLCRLAGAAKVEAVAHDETSAWGNGIGDALTVEGAVYRSANDINLYRKVDLPLGLLLRDTMVVHELLDADVFINLPVAKHHGGSQLTIAMKNYMGLNWDRQVMHRSDLDQCIADLATVRRPDLTIIDATRILLSNGPAGPGSVRETQTIIASTDMVAADALAATLFQREPRDIRHIRYAGEMGLGEIDLKRMDITKLNV